MPGSSERLAPRLRVYAITDHRTDGLEGRVRAALEAGVGTFQLRLKGLEARALFEVTRRLLPFTRAAGALLIVNDRLDVAMAAGADGAHLGPDDLPMDAARTIAPPGFILGGSAGSVEAARALERAGADYLGVGAIFDAHPTKPDASRPRGLEILTEVATAVSVPIVAIGGVSLERAPSCIEAGASGVAVVRAILGQPGPIEVERAARAFVEVTT